MNEGPENTAEGQTGEALADALRAAAADPVTPPPVADVVERAARRARQQTVRRRVGSVAASVVLVAGGLLVWNSVGGDGRSGSIRTEDLVEGSDDDGVTESTAPQPYDGADPTESSTGPVLEWQEVEGPDDGFGTLSTLADGRVLLQVHADGAPQASIYTSAAFVTDDGRTWEPVPLPRGVDARVVALDGDRWIVTGQLASASDPLDTIRVSDDQGESWQSPYIRGLTDTDGNVTSESFVTSVVRFGDSLAAALLPLSVVDQNFTVMVIDPEGVRSTREFSSALFWPRLLQVDGTLVVSEFTSAAAPPEAESVSVIAQTVWTTTDGEVWAQVTSPTDDFFTHGVGDGAVWGTGIQDGEAGLSVRRLIGEQVEEVASFPALTGFAPQAVSSNGLAVGPSGLATVLQLGGVGSSSEDQVPDAEGLPVGVVASKDGIDFVFDEDGTSHLVDTTTGEVLRTFTAPNVGGIGAPGTVTGGQESDFWIRFEDPETGEELVTFTEDDIVAEVPASVLGAAAPAASTPESADDEGGELGDPETPLHWIAWSADGHAWGFQSVADAFGLPEGGVAPRRVAVGDGFVVAAVSENPSQPPEGGPATGSLDRWFVAEVE